MKSWEKPMIVQLDIQKTMYSGRTSDRVDHIYVNDDGHWQCDFES